VSSGKIKKWKKN